MSYYKDQYRQYQANPKSEHVKLADDVSLIYVPTTTKIESRDAVISHVKKQDYVVKKRSEQIISSIEGSDALCLDMETTLEFMEGGGAYLPSLDDNFLADRVVTFPTMHIVTFVNNEIKQIRIYWDQGSLLKQVEVIGARGRAWPIRDGKDQIRCVKTAANESSTPSFSSSTQRELPQRPASPGKRHIKDPYAAESLTDLLSPSKEAAALEMGDSPPRSASAAKRYTKDPYGAGSLNELLSPSKKAAEPMRPYAQSSSRPPQRNISELFLKDDDIPDSPSKPQRRVPKIIDDEEDNAGLGPVDENRSFYKTLPGKYSHFEIGGDNNSNREIQHETRPSKTYTTPHWEFDDFATPKKPSRAPRGEEVRHFGFENEKDFQTPPGKANVVKPRRDADVHFELTDDDDKEEARIISSYGGRGKNLYQNRLYDEHGDPELTEKEMKQEPLGVVGNAANRKKNFDSHSQWEMTDDSPKPNENIATQNHSKAVKMMESSWDNFEDSPEPKRTATALRDPKRHNQPSWTHGDE
ncbi:hypothetical protein N7522_004980 [Penicillium canescens]|uniref:Uncharacterized protein n=1 Tax=Penicillium canescens TaxID=5083 RepID=A0AAD6N2Z6_PENCN|nr:uncharacterized protein N7446_004867 [Penicillium canescens]KAJ6009964.1 hypothetical protein N7522_004980 [Penicillium canescens]KAJ6026532.1 hypothetical protein N7460_011349 [Penicillium canescens]KAJ6039817.1 hypothetical protein N7444_008722 [Penicillium canescens]KAJ6067830.1 hypothetical protein N7446_004867 [Penicillium canescens]